MTYQIKDIDGNVKFEAQDSNSALGKYYTVRDETGYAEVWCKGKCIFKTK